MATIAGGQENLPDAVARGSKPPNGPNLLSGDLLLLLRLLLGAPEEAGVGDDELEEVDEVFC